MRQLTTRRKRSLVLLAIAATALSTTNALASAQPRADVSVTGSSEWGR